VADIFVSYTSSDRDWAFWIAKELRALGHAPHVHEWEINAGDDIYAWMEAHEDAADHVLCVISDEYLKAPNWRGRGKLLKSALQSTRPPMPACGCSREFAAYCVQGFSDKVVSAGRRSPTMRGAATMQQPRD
jgi:hypothetical protein